MAGNAASVGRSGPSGGGAVGGGAVRSRPPAPWRGTRGGAAPVVVRGGGAAPAFGGRRPGVRRKRRDRVACLVFSSFAWARMSRWNRAACICAAIFARSLAISASRAFISAMDRSIRCTSSTDWPCSAPQCGQRGAASMSRPHEAHRNRVMVPLLRTAARRMDY
ncbi:hypothetical protein [Micromonospora zhanjiangensis]